MFVPIKYQNNKKIHLGKLQQQIQRRIRKIAYLVNKTTNTNASMTRKKSFYNNRSVQTQYNQDEHSSFYANSIPSKQLKATRQQCILNNKIFDVIDQQMYQVQQSQKLLNENIPIMLVKPRKKWDKPPKFKIKSHNKSNTMQWKQKCQSYGNQNQQTLIRDIVELNDSLEEFEKKKCNPNICLDINQQDSLDNQQKHIFEQDDSLDNISKISYPKISEKNQKLNKNTELRLNLDQTQKIQNETQNNNNSNILYPYSPKLSSVIQNSQTKQQEDSSSSNENQSETLNFNFLKSFLSQRKPPHKKSLQSQTSRCNQSKQSNKSKPISLKHQPKIIIKNETKQKMAEIISQKINIINPEKLEHENTQNQKNSDKNDQPIKDKKQQKNKSIIIKIDNSKNMRANLLKKIQNRSMKISGWKM